MEVGTKGTVKDLKKQPLVHIRQAVILAGGRGERLRPLTDSIPKCMAPINGIPFLDYLIHSVMSVSIPQILILVGYKGEVIKERYGNSLSNKLKITYSTDQVEVQTGRRVLNAYELLDDYFILLYGDNYWPIQIDQMLDLYNRKQVMVSTTVFSNKNGTGEYGFENNVEVGDDHMVKLYDKQRKSSGANGVDIGYFIVDKRAMDPKIRGNISFEQDILPELISQRQLAAYVTDTQYYYITNMDTLKKFESVVIEQKLPCFN